MRLLFAPLKLRLVFFCGLRFCRQSFRRPNDRFLPLACRPKSPSVALPLRLSPRSPKPYTRSTARPKAAHDLSRATRFTFPRSPCGVQRGRSSALPTRSPQANQLPASGLPLAAREALPGPPLRRMQGFIRSAPRRMQGFVWSAPRRMQGFIRSASSPHARLRQVYPSPHARLHQIRLFAACEALPDFPTRHNIADPRKTDILFRASPLCAVCRVFRFAPRASSLADCKYFFPEKRPHPRRPHYTVREHLGTCGNIVSSAAI